MEAAIVDGNGTETGHIIVATIGGKRWSAKEGTLVKQLKRLTWLMLDQDPSSLSSQKGSRHYISTPDFQTISYMAERIVGQGLFGIVFQAKCLDTGETVAIKKVSQDKRHKNWELQTMRLLDHPNIIHPNIVSLNHCFSTTEKDELYLNLVLKFVPETLYRLLRHYSKANQRMPMINVRLYVYQLEALAHPFFDELRGPNARLPNGRPLPPLFNFRPQELKGASSELLNKLLPEHAKKQCPLLGF